MLYVVKTLRIICGMRIRWRFLTLPMLIGALLARPCAAAEALGNVRVGRIVVLKAERQLQLLSHGTLLKSYKVALGPNSTGPK